MLEIVLNPDERLRTPCVPVTKFNAELVVLARQMTDTMLANNGIGLAANQVGRTERLIVICLSTDKTAPLVLVNPVVLKAQNPKTLTEGCLSFPGQYSKVCRPSRIKVRFQKLDGQAQTQKFNELQAACIQHEIDHLDGLSFLDR